MLIYYSASLPCVQRREASLHDAIIPRAPGGQRRAVALHAKRKTAATEQKGTTEDKDKVKN